jgi:D-serine deaminase-like pyridoxal phosphate-dependent protein
MTVSGERTPGYRGALEVTLTLSSRTIIKEGKMMMMMFYTVNCKIYSLFDDMIVYWAVTVGQPGTSVSPLASRDTTNQFHALAK